MTASGSTRRESPPGAFGDTATRVLFAVMTQKRPTVESVAVAVGRCGSVTHKHLQRLRWAGLVDWVRDGKGTLRATVTHLPPIATQLDGDWDG